MPLAGPRARRPRGSWPAGLSSRWVGAPSPWRPAPPWCRPRDPAFAAVEEMEGCLESASSLPLCLQYGDLPLNYIFILSAILAAYMICKRLLENSPGKPGVLSAPAPWELGLGSRRGTLSLPRFAPCCLSELLPLRVLPPAPPQLPLRKSGRVRQLKLPLGCDFTSPARIGEPLAAKFLAAGAGLCTGDPKRGF